MSRKRVEYFYDCDIGNYHYGPGHPMRPHRVRMTHNLIVEYGLYKKMNIFRPELVSAAHMTRFHSDDYIHFLRQVTPDSMGEYFQQLTRFNIGHDCPVFDGLFDYCRVRRRPPCGAGQRRCCAHHRPGLARRRGGAARATRRPRPLCVCASSSPLPPPEPATRVPRSPPPTPRSSYEHPADIHVRVDRRRSAAEQRPC
jgi:hypothetical protein